jgi:hypothetical protein
VIVFAGVYISWGRFELVPSFRGFAAGASRGAVGRDRFPTAAPRRLPPLSLFAIAAVPGTK